MTARADAWGGQEHRLFHMGTNYRNAREIFDYAAAVVRTEVPDADIPEAVRETGIPPREGSLGELAVDAVAAEVARLGEDVDGTIAVITPAGMPQHSPGWTARPRGECACWTRCRPRVWSGTRRSSSIPTRSCGSLLAAYALFMSF